MIHGIAQELASHNSQPILSRISISVQIAFFAATGVLAVMSYATARKTIFQPLRVEIFKKQLESLSQILALFSGRGEVDLRDDFALDQLINVNIIRMYDDYAHFAFGVKQSRENRPYGPRLCPVSRFTKDQETGNVEGLELNDNYIDPRKAIKRKGREEQAPDAPDGKEISEQWDYKNAEIHLPRAFVEKGEEFRRLIDDPLCPKSIVSLMEKYLEDIDNNITAVEKVILECAKEMPSHYPSIEDLEDSDSGWIVNKITGRWANLQPAAKLIIDTCRAYFGSDDLLSSRKSIRDFRIKPRRARQNPPL
jgi:hypothetical protein